MSAAISRDPSRVCSSSIKARSLRSLTSVPSTTQLNVLATQSVEFSAPLIRFTQGTTNKCVAIMHVAGNVERQNMILGLWPSRTEGRGPAPSKMKRGAFLTKHESKSGLGVRITLFCFSQGSLASLAHLRGTLAGRPWAQRWLVLSPLLG